MSKFICFNTTGDKKIAIRADRIVSALELDNGGCYIHTDDGGEYEVSNLMSQFLEIMDDSSDKKVADILTNKSDDDYTEKQMKLIAACEILASITGVECGYDIAAEVEIAHRGAEALAFAKKKDKSKCKMCLDAISEYCMSNTSLMLADNIRDAIHDAYEAILT